MLNVQRVLIAVCACTLLVFVIACSGSTNTSRENTANSTAPEPKSPYKFVDTKTETSGQNNVMDLYSYSGELNVDELSDFCKVRKDRSTTKGFHFVVIFDDAANARFPSSPFTSKYGLEDDTQKHIRAIYVYNRSNGLSELSFHEKNIFEYIPTRKHI